MVLSVDVPDGLEREIDSEVEKGRYQNKSELVRDAIRRLLEERNEVERVEMSKEYVEEVKRRMKQVEEGKIGLDDMRTMEQIVDDEGLELVKFYFHPMADKEFLELSRDKQKFDKDVVREFKE